MPAYDLTIVHFLPILTTAISAIFAATVFGRYKARGGGAHLLWWAGGIVVYGAGTFAEGWITLWGWNPVIFKFWYVVGALLGGAPLAQGTVWLLLQPATARRLTWGLVAVVSVATVCVVLSPIDYSVVDEHLPSGRAFGWQWVRSFSPFINTYAVIFLIGGAALSAWRFRTASVRGGSPIARDRFVGNAYIAVGAVLPGLGGAASRAGHTEILYIMELLGIMLIWTGYWFNVRRRPIGGRASAAIEGAQPRSVVLSIVVALALLAPAFSTTTYAQERAAPGLSITIEVRDADGGVLPRAVVVLRSVTDGSAQRVVSDLQGDARFDAVGAGRYTIEVRKPGFSSLGRAIVVAPGEPDRLRLALQIAPVRETVTVAATRSPRDVLRVPGEVTVIDRDAIEQLQARGFDDLLRYEPGVEMAESPRRLGQTFNIRGFDDERVLLLRDGARVSQFASGHRGNVFFDVEDVRQLEILRGPASALYGSGALGGVVSVRTLDPADMLAPGERTGAQLRGFFSSAYNEWMVTPRAFGQTDGGVGWLLGYTARRNDGSVRLAGNETRLSDAEENVNDVNARLVIPLTDIDRLRVSIGSYRNVGRTSANLSSLQVSPSELIDRGTREVTTTIGYQRTGPRWWDGDVRATAYWADTRIDEERLLDQRLDEIDYRTWGFDVRNRAVLGDAQAITFGVEVVNDRQVATRNGDAHAFFPDGSQTLTGLYAQDEISLVGGRLLLIPGVRWDRWSSRSDDPEIADQSVSAVTPKIGGAWELFDGAVATASYGEGFRAPRFRESFLSGVHFAFPLPGNRFFLALFSANPDLLPEESRNVDVGVRFRRGPVTARAAYWRASVDDFIELLPVFTAPFPPPGETQVEIWRADNVTSATLEGVEASLDWRLSPELSTRAAFSSGSGTRDDNSEPLLNTPAGKLVLGVDWSRYEIGTRVGVSARVYGARDRVPTGVEPTDGYTLLDFNLSWTPTFAPRFTGHFGIDNIADTDYTVPLFGVPGTGRDIRAGVTIDLGRTRRLTR